MSSCDTSDIKEVYYINLDSSTKRNKNFKENYTKHSLGPNVPVTRISGVFLMEEPKELSKQNLRQSRKIQKNEVGCSLSHIKTLDIISKKKDGWYLVCEDDCIGDFKKMQKKIKHYMRIFPHVSAINIIPYNIGRKIPFQYHWSPGWGICTSSYIIKPRGAKIMKKIIEDNLYKKPCDVALRDAFKPYFIVLNMYNNTMSTDQGFVSDIR